MAKFVESPLGGHTAIMAAAGERYRITYTLETPDGDVWEFDNLEEARRNQYIFGGTITKNLEE